MATMSSRTSSGWALLTAVVSSSIADNHVRMAATAGRGRDALWRPATRLSRVGAIVHPGPSMCAPCHAEVPMLCANTYAATVAWSTLDSQDRRNGVDVTTYAGQRAAVVGGSIGGLTAALLLDKLGFAVDVYERTPTELD